MTILFFRLYAWDILALQDDRVRCWKDSQKQALSTFAACIAKLRSTLPQRMLLQFFEKDTFEEIQFFEITLAYFQNKLIILSNNNLHFSLFHIFKFDKKFIYTFNALHIFKFSKYICMHHYLIFIEQKLISFYRKFLMFDCCMRAYQMPAIPIEIHLRGVPRNFE